jgi:Na+/melibiose symporter-like transporter
MRDEELRRGLAHRQIRRERWRRRLPWLLLGVATLLTLALFGPSLLSFLLALGVG